MTLTIAEMTKPNSSSFALLDPFPLAVLIIIVAVAIPLGNFKRSISIICFLRGTITTTPNTAPLSAARAKAVRLSVILKLIPILVASKNMAGRVKVTPEPDVLIPEATVWFILFSMEVPFLKTPF